MFKPCPFCGSANLESGGDDKIVAVRCRDCEATGPNHYGSRAEWNTRSLHLPEPQTATEPYTPPQVGEPCDAEGVKSIQDAASLLRQWAKALRANSEHTVETIAIVNGICVADDLDGIADFLAGVAAPAPADAERLALADRLENHVRSRLPGSEPVIQNGAWQMMLDAAKLLRAGGWREDMVARPIAEYHEDMGDVLWWKFPITEAPYVGTPNDLGFAVEVSATTAFYGDKKMTQMVGGWPGDHTHFTPIPLPSAPYTDKEG